MTQAAVEASEMIVRDVRLATQVAGTGPTLLYLHDELSTGWNAYLDQLAVHFHVIAPDLPGFGDSERPDWIENTDDMAFFLADVADAAGDGAAPFVVGNGLGGWLALEAGVRSQAAINRLIVVGCPGLGLPGDPPADYFFLTPEERTALFFNDVSFAPVVSEDHLVRNEMMTARLVWQPRYVSRSLATASTAYAHRRWWRGAQTTAFSRWRTGRRLSTDCQKRGS